MPMSSKHDSALSEITIDSELACDLYAKMLRIRFFELRVIEIFTARMKVGDFPGALHTYDGQEAVAVGVCSVLREDDYVFSTHRGHGHAIAKGVDLKGLMAELNGRATGICRGFGGSMHIYDPAKGFMGTSGVVGGNLPLCLGTAYSSVALARDRVTVCFFGEGGSAQGSSHESLNMAAIMRWPVVYVCENNLYAATTHVSVNCPTKNVAARAQAYGVPGIVVDGNDVLAVRDVARQAVERARAGGGPSLIECKTYRHKAHCMVIPEHRPSRERNEWTRNDPIPRFRSKILATGAITEEGLTEIEQREKEQLEEAVRFMEVSPLPDPKTVGLYLWT